MVAILDLIWDFFEMLFGLIGIILEHFFTQICQKIKGGSQVEVKTPAENYEQQYAGDVREVVASAISSSRLHADLNNITSVMILANFLYTSGRTQHWTFEFSVTASVQALVGKDIAGSLEILNKVLRNKKNDAIKSFNEKQVQLTNSVMTAEEKNRIWEQYFSNNSCRLNEWLLTDLKIADRKVTGNLEIREMPEVQNFSPYMVFWQETPQQMAP